MKLFLLILFLAMVGMAFYLSITDLITIAEQFICTLLALIWVTIAAKDD